MANSVIDKLFGKGTRTEHERLIVCLWISVSLNSYNTTIIPEQRGRTEYGYNMENYVARTYDT